MSPGNSSTGPLTTDRPPAKNPDEKFTATIARHDDRAVQVWATVFYVVGCRGRLRCVLVVRCGFCQHMHQHTAQADFINGWRKASCGHGRYLVHAVAVEGAA